MTERMLRAVGSVLLIAGLVAACSATPATSTAPAASDASAATLPDGFPIGTWTTTITEADLQAAGVTDVGGLGENSGDFTLVMSPDQTWSTTQVSPVPLRWPVFKGTWTALDPDGFRQTTTFPTDFSGDVVDFTWKIEDGGLILKVVNPPDPILPIIMESHPWKPAG